MAPVPSSLLSWSRARKRDELWARVHPTESGASGSSVDAVAGQTYDDDLFRSVADQWSGMTVLAPEDLSSWHSTVLQVATEYDQIRGLGSWLRGPDDFFGILGIGRLELFHSAMLAWLLDPEGRHGLGRRFLDLLLVGYVPGLEPSAMRVRTVQLEAHRIETRADIVVWGDAATLIIETKVDAGEGFRQCDRLFERFSEEPGPRFLFLTPTGRPPLTATGDAAAAFSTVAFSNIASVLERALEESERAETSVVAFNYVRTLKREFG